MSAEAKPRWPRRRLKYALRRGLTPHQSSLLRSVGEVPFVPMEAIGDRGELDLSRTRPLEEVANGYSRFFEGDVVVAKITPCFENGKGALIKGTGGVGFGTTELHVLSPDDCIDGTFLYYITMGADFRGAGVAMMSGAAGQKRVPDEFVQDFWVGVPGLPLQRAIAAYLDRETAKIDAMIAAKERLLSLLAEKRRALITHAVIRGLNPDASMRESGVEWLGEVPEHWHVERLAYQFKERDERNRPELPLLEVSLNHGVIRREFSSDKIESTASDFNTYKVARQGDIVFNKMRMWQGAVGAAPINGLVSPDYVVAEPVGDLLSRFAAMLFRIPAFSAECGRRSYGLVWDRLRLYWDGFRDIRVAVPPRAEQEAIVRMVSDRCSSMDAFESQMQRSIAFLHERRGALIAAAVTGVIDVEDAA